MTESRLKGWRLLLEGLVVLVSILAAFFLEGWRDDREAAQALADELGSLRTEIERNRDLVAAHLEILTRIDAGGSALLEVLDASSAASVLVPDTLAWLQFGYDPSINPSLGAVEALISSGRLAQIDNPELRLALAGLQDLFGDAMEDELEARRLTGNQLTTLVSTVFDLALVTPIGKDYFERVPSSALSHQERQAGRALTSYQSVNFPNSLEMRNLIRVRLSWYQSGRVEMVGLIPHLSRSSPDLCVKAEEAPRLRLGCLGDLLFLEE